MSSNNQTRYSITIDSIIIVTILYQGTIAWLNILWTFQSQARLRHIKDVTHFSEKNVLHFYMSYRWQYPRLSRKLRWQEFQLKWQIL